MNKPTLGDRMKGYERAFEGVLPGRIPVIIRLDGKAFHALTRGTEKPFDDSVIQAMNTAMLALCEEVQGTVLAYTQSDEISLLLHNYQNQDSQPWFGNEIQKMVSISAAVASTAFTLETHKIFGKTRTALFDSRVFVLPESEVSNYFLWRQRDSIRNAINTIGQAIFSPRELHKKNIDQVKKMLLDKDVDVDDREAWPLSQIRGRCAVRTLRKDSSPRAEGIYKMQWTLDENIPLFQENRNYVGGFFKT